MTAMKGPKIFICDGCLVNLRQALKGYAEVADAEDDDDCNR